MDDKFSIGLTIIALALIALVLAVCLARVGFFW